LKVYNKDNVLEASLKRIRYFFDEFEDVVVAFSGGKDSTVTLKLAIMVATELKRLPVKVMFIDQEAEWTSVIEYIRRVMNSKEVEPLWFQIPIKIFNANSFTDNWLQCWDVGQEWMRAKEEVSIKNNTFGTDRFRLLFDRIINSFAKRTCLLSGIRTDEAPSRLISVSTYNIYKGLSYGRKISNRNFCFYPIYDWKYSDVWKFINEYDLDYCKLYDLMYQYGVKTNDMRVSNLNHVTAKKCLLLLQEIEPQTWEKLTERLVGINTTKHTKNIKIELPVAFKDYKEYRNYLIANLITEDAIKTRMFNKFNALDKVFGNNEKYDRETIKTILSNDFYFKKLKNFRNRPLCKKTQLTIKTQLTML